MLIRRIPRVFSALLLVLASFLPVRPTVPDAWGWPVDAPRQVLEEFVAPATDYAAGHRGLDLASEPGAPVFAPSDGVVSFSGVVVDRAVLSIRHAGDLTSTVEPVVAVVSAGDPVSRGQLVGHVAAGGHCATRCLHLGARLHGRYVSPRLYLGGIRRAVLLPTIGPPARPTLWDAR